MTDEDLFLTPGTVYNPMPTKSKRIELSVTLNQLNDIIVCMHHAMNRGLGYGPVTRQELGLLEGNRARLLQRLRKLSPSE